MNASEAGGYLTLIQTSLLLSFKCQLVVSKRKTWFTKQKQWGLYRNKGYLPFTRENQKFQLENQMVRAIPFGKLLIIYNGNRTEWSPIRSVIIRVINKIGRPRSGSPICYSQVWLQTELDDTMSCYQLIKTMTKLEERTKHWLSAERF